MSTVMIRTTAGAAHDHAVRIGAVAASPISSIVLLSGAAVFDIPAILALTSVPGIPEFSFVRRSDTDCDFAITEESSTSTRIEAHLVESVDGFTVTGVAIVLGNGVIWGYAPYLPNQGGLPKTKAFSWTLDLLITESPNDATALALTYEPLDYRSMRDKLLLEVRNQLNIEALADMLNQAQQTCLVDGNDLSSSWSLDGGDPEPLCQTIPIEQTLPSNIDGGIQ